jgi:threonine dehydrogenase-like Zn-dependent dehydrogenase
LTSAWVIENSRCHQIDSAAAAPKDNEVVVAVEASQISPAQTLLDTSDGLVPGISAVGIVVAAGEQALGLLGKRVLVGTTDPCGECIVCRRGRAGLCPAATRRGGPHRGTLAQRVTVQARWTIVLDSQLPVGGVEAAAIAGDAAAAYTLYACSNLSSNDAVVVCGQSAVSRFLIEILRAKGIIPTVIVDGATSIWSDWVIRQGAALCSIPVNPTYNGVDVVGAVAASMRARLPDATAHRAWRIIATDTASLPSALATATSPGAQLMLWAPPTQRDSLQQFLQSAHIALAEMLNHESTLTSVTAPHPDLLIDVAAMVAKQEIQLAAGVEIMTVETLGTVANDVTRSLVVALSP